MSLKAIFIITPNNPSNREITSILDKWNNNKHTTQFVDKTEHYFKKYIKHISIYPPSNYELSFPQYLEEYEKDVVILDGKFGHYINPNARYDSVSEQKEFNNTLPLTVSLEKVSSAMKCQIDYDEMHRSVREHIVKELSNTNQDIGQAIMENGYNWPSFIILEDKLYRKFSELDLMEDKSVLSLESEDMRTFSRNWNFLANGIWNAIPEEWYITVRFVNV